VIQKHAASHLHYDFRLEFDGVLKSWAVPKGLPLAKGKMHSAFETEDHPLAYLDFEGNIPKGQYGGGTVMVWDIGTYDLVEGQYGNGQLTVALDGRKLKGKWTLKRFREERGKAVWLVFRRGANMEAPAPRVLDRSAVTRRTLEEIAADKSSVWESR
jgi:bifunctional non-homologous end joining protein LigD